MRLSIRKNKKNVFTNCWRHPLSNRVDASQEVTPLQIDLHTSHIDDYLCYLLTPRTNFICNFHLIHLWTGHINYILASFRSFEWCQRDHFIVPLERLKIIICTFLCSACEKNNKTVSNLCGSKADTEVIFYALMMLKTSRRNTQFFNSASDCHRGLVITINSFFTAKAFAERTSRDERHKFTHQTAKISSWWKSLQMEKS